MDRWLTSKNVLLIMPSGWTASGGVGVRSSQSKVDILGGPPVMPAEATVQVEHRLNLARQIGKIATRIDRRFLAMSDPLTSDRHLLQAPQFITVVMNKIFTINF